MADSFPEADWEIFREIQTLALERFCKRALEEMDSLRHDTSRSHHHRYLNVSRYCQARDEELARAFTDARRSDMIVQLAAIHSYGLLELHELERFSARTRQTIESIVSGFTG